MKPIASSRVRPKSTAAPAGAASGPKVFFDGDCPLCRREIAHYRRIDRTGRLRWIDIASEADTLSGYGLTLDRAMAELHALDSAGRWQRGIDGFLVIWMHLPAYRWLARLVQILGLRAPLRGIYRRFALALPKTLQGGRLFAPWPDAGKLMRVYTLQQEQRVARPLERVFPFFSQPENLALITPPSLGFRLLTPRPVAMEKGRTIDYTIRVMGLPIRWRTLITRFDPPWCFADEQLFGPYSFWHHTHRFRQDKGETVLYDEVRYALPAALPAPLRDLLHSLYVRPALEHIFDYRRQVFAGLFGSARPNGACAPGAALAAEENAS